MCLRCFDTVGWKSIRTVKTEWWGVVVVICLERDADLHMAQLMPLPLTVSCFSKIQIGFTFLIPADMGSPGKRAIKRVCVCGISWTICKRSAPHSRPPHLTPQQHLITQFLQSGCSSNQQCQSTEGTLLIDYKNFIIYIALYFMLNFDLSASECFCAVEICGCWHVWPLYCALNDHITVLMC